MFWMTVAGAGVLAVVPGDALPQSLFGFWDKAQHVLAFSVMAVLGVLAYRGRWVRVAFGLLLYGLLIEFIQSFLPWRSAEVLDFVADSVGLALGEIIGYYVAKLKVIAGDTGTAHRYIV